MKLDEYQSAIYNYDIKAGNIALIMKAVAGSGKSECIIQKTVKFVEQDNISPKQIVLTTFSNKAARELLLRYKKQTKVKEIPLISTLHSVGVHILKEYFDMKFSIMTEWNVIKLIRDIVEELKIFKEGTYKKELTEFSKSVLEAISFYKSEIPEPYENILNGKFNIYDYIEPEGFSNKHFNIIFKLYEERKHKFKLLDYDDLIYLTYKLLNENSKILTKVRKSLTHYIIDEAQDLNRVQFELIALLSREQVLIIVGDTEQSIYGFRWARVDMFSKEWLSQHFGTVVQFPLLKNYRSTANIVKVSNMVRQIAKSDLMAIPNRKQSPGSVIFKVVKTNVQEGSLIAETIKKEIENDIPLKDIYITVRTNHYLKTVVEPALVRCNIPYVFQTRASGKKLVDKPLNKLYFSLFAYWVNPSDILSITYITSCIKGVGDSFINSYEKALYTYTPDAAAYYFDTSSSKVKANKVSEVLMESKEYFKDLQDPDLPLKDFYHYMRQFIQDNFKTLGSTEDFDTLEKTITNWFNHYLEEFEMQRSEILNQITLEIDNFEEDENIEAVRIGTVHSSKGQTHVVSIISGFNYYKERQFDRDEAYMLYVQVSRAAERLYIFDSNYISTADNGTRIPFKNPYFTALRKEITGK